jgi:prophage regulatory protein
MPRQTRRRRRMSRPAPSTTLPAEGYVRLATVLAMFPVNKRTWWRGVKAGRYPAGVKLQERITAWRVDEIRALLEGPA